ncbi:MAG: 1-acyl-sn-glycerol-3-phosphate acyltransferase, partial [Actinomycetota bacterium]|nr:1-acyl-sn-glycerol-3-phosphate acyltransferase [Actinomycetota bacterium]
MSARRPGRARGAIADAEPVYWLVIRLLDLFVHAAFRLSIVGGDAVPRSGPALVAANHVSHMDPVVLIVALHRLRRRVRFLAVEDVFRHPVAGPL